MNGKNTKDPGCGQNAHIMWPTKGSSPLTGQGHAK